MLLLLSSLALAGYGDPLDGHPDWSDRELHTWSNAARVAPEAWDADYRRGKCSYGGFLPDEKVGKPGLRWNHDLGRAARYHNDDMVRNNFFSHTSSDGTKFEDRLPRFYKGTAYGENIANGYSSSREVVLEGWMCSPGHRSNIMESIFDELGVAGRASKYTQDFGRRGVLGRGIAMANHEPERPSGTATFRADVWGDGLDVDAVEVVVNGEVHEMDRVAGDAELGLYEVDVAADSGCHTWYVEARFGGSILRFPEDGSYGWGSCDWDDASAGWVNEQIEPEDVDPGTDSDTESETDGDTETDTEPEGGDEVPEMQGRGFSCSTAPTPAVWTLLLLPVVWRRRRR